MPRPQKCRRICFTPQYDSFYPENSQTDDTITLTLDEYEVIRLVDLEKKTHEQCSAQMDVSRTTVTEIYESARYKLAQCIVNGKRLIISGGNYRRAGISPLRAMHVPHGHGRAQFSCFPSTTQQRRRYYENCSYL